MTPKEITLEARKLGLRLKPAGDKLAVMPKGKCPPSFGHVLRENKPALLSYLEGRAAGLPDDCIPWLHIARQIMDGEWQGIDDSTLQSLRIGLRSVPHPLAKSALERLER